MKLSSYNIGGMTVFSPREAIVHTECAELRGFVAEKAISVGSSQVILDLSEVPFIDSAGLELLCDLKTACAETGGHLIFACLTDVCHEIFRLTDLAGQFEIFDSVEEGVKSLE